MGYKINVETSTGAIAEYAKLANYTATCTDDKQAKTLEIFKDAEVL